MKSDSVLDNMQSTREFDEYLAPNEQIVWYGRPFSKFSIISPGFRESILYFCISLLLVLFPLYMIPNPMYLILFFFQGLLCAFALFGISSLCHTILGSIKRKSTRYVVTNKRLLFIHQTLSNTKVEHLDLTEINSIGIEEMKNGKGSLYFKTKNTTFKSKNLETGEKHLYPTFESILEAREIRNVITDQQKQKNLILKESFPLKDPEVISIKSKAKS